jgi:hypothetical protein
MGLSVTFVTVAKAIVGDHRPPIRRGESPDTDGHAVTHGF